MTRLAALQRGFMAALEAERPPADARLAIYHRTVRANRQGALAAAYPVIRRLVGDAFFGGVAEAYGRAFPSRSGDLHRYGDSLASFVCAYAPARALDYLPDVARLEWAIHESAFAADGATFDYAALAGVPPERYGAVRLRLQPAARLLESPHPVVAIWEANQPGRDGSPERAEGPDLVLVARQGFTPAPQRLAPAEWSLLRAVAGGASLDEACAAMGEEAALLGEIVARHAAAGVVCGFAFPG